MKNVFCKNIRNTYSVCYFLFFNALTNSFPFLLSIINKTGDQYVKMNHFSGCSLVQWLLWNLLPGEFFKGVCWCVIVLAFIFFFFSLILVLFCLVLLFVCSW